MPVIPYRLPSSDLDSPVSSTIQPRASTTTNANGTSHRNDRNRDRAGEQTTADLLIVCADVERSVECPYPRPGLFDARPRVGHARARAIHQGVLLVVSVVVRRRARTVHRGQTTSEALIRQNPIPFSGPRSPRGVRRQGILPL